MQKMKKTEGKWATLICLMNNTISRPPAADQCLQYTRKKNFLIPTIYLTGKIIYIFLARKGIHSKRSSNWSTNSADNLEFSAERLSENAKSIKITLVAELLPVISPIYVQSLQ